MLIKKRRAESQARQPPSLQSSCLDDSDMRHAHALVRTSSDVLRVRRTFLTDGICVFRATGKVNLRIGGTLSTRGAEVDVFRLSRFPIFSTIPMPPDMLRYWPSSQVPPPELGRSNSARTVVLAFTGMLRVRRAVRTCRAPDHHRANRVLCLRVGCLASTPRADIHLFCPLTILSATDIFPDMLWHIEHVSPP